MEEVGMTDPYAGQPGPGAPYPGGPQPGPGVPARQPKRRINARLIVGLVLLVLLIVFSAENTRSVRMRLIGPEVHAPLFLALLIAALVGVLIGLVVRRRRRPKA
jgi:putative membrane protein